jgi:hypothetical protein
MDTEEEFAALLLLEEDESRRRRRRRRRRRLREEQEAEEQAVYSFNARKPYQAKRYLWSMSTWPSRKFKRRLRMDKLRFRALLSGFVQSIVTCEIGFCRDEGRGVKM